MGVQSHYLLILVHLFYHNADAKAHLQGHHRHGALQAECNFTAKGGRKVKTARESEVKGSFHQPVPHDVKDRIVLHASDFQVSSGEQTVPSGTQMVPSSEQTVPSSGSGIGKTLLEVLNNEEAKMPKGKPPSAGDGQAAGSKQAPAPAAVHDKETILSALAGPQEKDKLEGKSCAKNKEWGYVGCGHGCTCGYFESCYPKFVDLKLQSEAQNLNVGICQPAVWVLCLISVALFLGGVGCIIFTRRLAIQYNEYWEDYEHILPAQTVPIGHVRVSQVGMGRQTSQKLY